MKIEQAAQLGLLPPEVDSVKFWKGIRKSTLTMAKTLVEARLVDDSEAEDPNRRSINTEYPLLPVELKDGDDIFIRKAVLSVRGQCRTLPTWNKVCPEITFRVDELPERRGSYMTFEYSWDRVAHSKDLVFLAEGERIAAPDLFPIRDVLGEAGDVAGLWTPANHPPIEELVLAAIPRGARQLRHSS